VEEASSRGYFCFSLRDSSAGRPSPPFLPNFINSPSIRSGLVQTKPDAVSPEALTGQSSQLKTLDLTGPGPDRPGLDLSSADHSEHCMLQWLAEACSNKNVETRFCNPILQHACLNVAIYPHHYSSHGQSRDGISAPLICIMHCLSSIVSSSKMLPCISSRFIVYIFARTSGLAHEYIAWAHCPSLLRKQVILAQFNLTLTFRLHSTSFFYEIAFLTNE
jgi:hypothetical protein